MFEDRAQRERREERQAGDDDDDADDEEAEQGVFVGIVPAVAGTFGLAASEPPIASAGMMVKKRPISIEMPCVVVYHWVPVPW